MGDSYIMPWKKTTGRTFPMEYLTSKENINTLAQLPPSVIKNINAILDKSDNSSKPPDIHITTKIINGQKTYFARSFTRWEKFKRKFKKFIHGCF